MDAPESVEPRPGMSKQEVCEWRAKPRLASARRLRLKAGKSAAEIREERMKKIIQFFKESYAELRKVIWPSKEDVVSSVVVVIISTAIVAAALGLVDFLLTLGIRTIF